MSAGDADRLGATPTDGATRFLVWAPAATASVTVHFPDRPGGGPASAELTPAEHGYWGAAVDGIGHGDRYWYALDGTDPLPDPASGWQPDGVHGPSAVVDARRFAWTDAEWRGRGIEASVLYELHVGTFTSGGTFDTAIDQLARLATLGITTIEVMPINAFPGERNWGYDGAFPYAVQQSYGGPEALARFVDAAHAHGLAVILDVVYNHLGPEGNYLGRYGPYFTDAHFTPWGEAINVAEAGSDGVRRFYVENATRWIRDFHVDGFRFDAVHAIVDPTAIPFWEQVCRAARDEARRARRAIALIAESSDNDPRQLHPPERNGIGFDAVWCDDVHHHLRVAMTGERRAYYADYDGVPAELADTVTHRWKFRGQYSVARGRHHGRPIDDAAPDRFVAFTQNHDQVGNRPAGDRPDHHLDPARRRFAPAVVLLSPYTPMLFMGEEYGERHPFPFFVDHTDRELLEATRRGRREEFSGADWSVAVPDPGAVETFRSAVLDPTAADRDDTARHLQAMYTELLRLRRAVAPVAGRDARQQVVQRGDVVAIRRTVEDRTSVVLVNESDRPATIDLDADLDAASMAAASLAFASDAAAWGGDGATGLDGRAVALAPWTVALVVG